MTTIPVAALWSSLRHALRGLLRRDVLTIYLVIFMCDLVSGILSLTFSLYAKDLGASLSFIGTLSSISGITQLLTSIPIGMISDRWSSRPSLFQRLCVSMSRSRLIVHTPKPARVCKSQPNMAGFPFLLR